jgi:biopolymer transport protein ExbD
VKFPRQKRADNSINLTPLIDVVFLLLIFFMVSTTFTRETRLTLELPEAQGEQAEKEKSDDIEVIVNSDGSYAVNGNSLVNRKIDTLMKALTQVSAGNTDVPLVITADANASHRAVVTVMDAAGRLGFVNLAITAQESREDENFE